jgi:hypothetical protein
MRDPNRIERIIVKLAGLWKEHPDQRLGQLIWNVANSRGSVSVFYVEDDDFEALLDKTLKEGFPKG